jgi:hypothetical protein
MARRRRVVRKKKAGRKPGRRPGVAGMSIAQLEAVIARRKALEAKGLQAKRGKLAKQLAEIDGQIAALGATPRRRRRRRAKKAAVRVVRRKRGRRKVAKKRAAVKAGKRMRSSPAQIERAQKAILTAIKGKADGLLRVELSKAVRARPQTLNTALKKLIEAKKLKTKGVTRNTRYLAA